ncbi:hypothetical protein ACOME3_001637 [Neoechinorhynchus agilis]
MVQLAHSLTIIIHFLYSLDATIPNDLPFPELFVQPYETNLRVSVKRNRSIGSRYDNCSFSEQSKTCPVFVLMENSYSVAIADFYICGYDRSDRRYRAGNMRYCTVNDTRFTTSYLPDQQGCSGAQLIAVDPIDREHESIVFLNLTATDFTLIGYPKKHFVLIVNILDENDCPPLFNQSVIFARLWPNHTLSEPIVRLEVYDPDEDNGTTLFLMDYNPDFFIDAIDGSVFARKRLAKEERFIRDLNVTAKDMGNGMTAQVKVKILVMESDRLPISDILAICSVFLIAFNLAMIMIVLNKLHRSSSLTYTKVSMWDRGMKCCITISDDEDVIPDNQSSSIRSL